MRSVAVLVVWIGALVCVARAGGADQEWRTVGGESGGSRYSTLNQINRGNVARLEVAWTYHCGDRGQAGTIECTPIVIGGVMYLTTGDSKVVALDAETGKQRWRYDPYDAQAFAGSSW